MQIRRTRLLEALEIATRSRVTTVVAPTGCGKSVLLAQWVAVHRRRRIRWLTADETDNDPRRFARALREAIGPTVAASGREGRSPRRVDPPTFLILDDAHLITNPRAYDELASELEENQALRVVLSARSDTAFPVHLFRLRDQVAEIRQRQLRFDHGEARELLTQLGGRRLSDSQVASLLQRTEGWAVGLQLAAVSLRSVENAEAFVERSHLDDRHVVDYLTERLLEVQDPAVEDFLLQTSVLSEMSVPLCNHVIRDTRSGRILEELERASIVVWALDGDGRWFRYHGLLRSLLRQHLRLANPELERELLLRAAEWQLLHDHVAEAIAYLVEAGATARAVEVVLDHAPHMLEEGRPDGVIRWVELLPRVVRTTDSTVLLLEAAARILAREVREPGHILRRFDVTASRSPGDEMAAETLRGVWLLQLGRPERALDAVDRALSQAAALPSSQPQGLVDLPGMRESLIALSRLARAIALVEIGELHEAREALGPALEGGPPSVEIEANGIAAVIDALSGRLQRATRGAGRALALAQEGGMAHIPATAPALVARAMVAREQEHFDCAAALLDAASRRADGARFVTELVRIERAELALRMGHLDDDVLVAERRGA